MWKLETVIKDSVVCIHQTQQQQQQITHKVNTMVKEVNLAQVELAIVVCTNEFDTGECVELS